MGTSSSSLENREARRQQRQQLQPYTPTEGAATAAPQVPEPAPYFLMFGGPQLPTRAPPQPYAAMLHYQMHQSRPGPPPVAEEQEMIAIKNLAALNKSSVQLVHIDDGDYQLQFTYDCTVPTTIEVRYACVEIAHQGLTFVQQNDQLIPGPPTTTVNPGAQQIYKCDPAHLLNVHVFERHLQYFPHCPNLYPIVVSLKYQVPETGAHQAQHTFLKVIAPSSSSSPVNVEGVGTSPSEPASPPSREYLAKVIKQKLEIDGAVYELEEIYGMGQEPKPGAGEDLDVNTCVICITNSRDTTVMPCRHMCLCSECAEQLRGQTNKCPICRTQIERLVTIHRQPPAESPA